MKTITGTTGAWLASSWITYSSDEFNNLRFYECDMTDSGWVKVGNASITVDLFSDSDVLNGKLKMLNEAEKRVKAEAQKQLTEIERNRQRLLAIEYKG